MPLAVWVPHIPLEVLYRYKYIHLHPTIIKPSSPQPSSIPTTILLMEPSPARQMRCQGRCRSAGKPHSRKAPQLSTYKYPHKCRPHTTAIACSPPAPPRPTPIGRPQSSVPGSLAITMPLPPLADANTPILYVKRNATPRHCGSGGRNGEVPGVSSRSQVSAGLGRLHLFLKSKCERQGHVCFVLDTPRAGHTSG
eukprot:353210-Chlamydomonas_euryale.AAC.3